MKHIKTTEAFRDTDDIVSRKVYWILPTNNKLEDGLVRLYKQYTEWQNPVEPIDQALGLAKNIREDKEFKDNFVLVGLEFTYDSLRDKVIKGPYFTPHPYSFEKILKERGYMFVGLVNVEQHEIDASKYNL